jgi:hypothetical protein
MIKLISAFGIILLTSLACESNHSYPDKIPDGIYTGTFQRQQAFGGGEVAQVTLTFSENTWIGQSDKPKYPALCHGTYKLDKQKIIVTNDCPWTAEFDATLILGGDYEFNLNGNHLEIIRSFLGPSTDTWSDKYILTKQK